MFVFVNVGVGVAFGSTVFVGVTVKVGVTVNVGVEVLVTVGVIVGVFDGVNVEVAVGGMPTWILTVAAEDVNSSSFTV